MNAELYEQIKSDADKKTILVAEDIESNYILLLAILRKYYNLVRAHDGQEAVELAKNNRYDTILMDIKMPIMDGLEATKKIREFNTETPILALTAHAFNSDRDLAVEAGCNDYLVKPIDRKLLFDALEKYCYSSH